MARYRTWYGAAKYIKNINFDKESRKILNPTQLLELDMNKLRIMEDWGILPGN